MIAFPGYIVIVHFRITFPTMNNFQAMSGMSYYSMCEEILFDKIVGDSSNGTTSCAICGLFHSWDTQFIKPRWFIKLFSFKKIGVRCPSYPLMTVYSYAGECLFQKNTGAAYCPRWCSGSRWGGGGGCHEVPDPP